LRDLRVTATFAPVQVSSPPTAERLTDELLGFLTYIVKGSSRDVFRVAAQLELSLSQLRALHLLDSADHELALSELAAAVDLSVAATGRAIDGLAKAGLVTRSEDPIDRRIKRLAPTDAGRATLGSIAAARRSALEDFVGTLSAEEIAGLWTALQPFAARVEAAGFGCIEVGR
jgi:DNA-binding MarR family transcriptional regulator